MAIRFSKTFLLRKLHQLTGIVPLGLFFFVHMYTNSTAMNGPKIFDEPVFNYTRDFPFVFEEVLLPVSYTSDRKAAESILLEVARRHWAMLKAVPT